jgi:hypothetical protein
MTRRLADLLSGLALLALSGWMFSCAVEVASYRPSFRPVTLAVEPSFLRQIEWQHSATFWFALGSITLVLGLVALLRGASVRRSVAR